jgi:hypothetical protein
MNFLKIKTWIAALVFFFVSTVSFAQAPPEGPPTPPDDPSIGGNHLPVGMTPATSGGGAPIGPGAGMLLLMGAGYGAMKFIRRKKE